MDKYLSWFLGPKAENSSTFEDLLNVMVKDCFHWRKNYLPNDPLLITKSEQRVFDEENDKLYQNVHEFLAALRRNFPFYNPRYIAHMLSDITLSKSSNVEEFSALGPKNHDRYLSIL